MGRGTRANGGVGAGFYLFKAATGFPGLLRVVTGGQDCGRLVYDSAT